MSTTTDIGVGGVLARCREENRAALVGYLPVGFPSVEGSVAAMVAMVEAGVDIVEVGIPYSDPLMDGPTIAYAADQALKHGVHVRDVFTATRAVRDAGAPPLVMSYWNLVLKHGPRRFAQDLAAAGGAGMITPDLIPDEAGEWIAASDETGLDRVFLVAPSSTPERIAAVTDQCRGFVYAVSHMGVTGARTAMGDAARVVVERTKAVTDKPVCVGLGVSGGAQAAEVAAYADGVIVGSALVRCLTDAPDEQSGIEALRSLVGELAEGVRSGR
ncbi:tryptophan synthase subunit alpha [Phycicoccus sp. M110.8]|uniref:tryptophan synthase subunit alpha n=1 Tax=Phycicoccus sp. M110.8 TaxID=3075433 RepID=UPI0028FD8C07|nr:tryptophan synthase subunit alpha [Phycicoccus sp. M110.8]MDU0315786.1 tryptophan synthase subunit alpha [Phycicoccus sp. M110.8]